ncbi:MAG TPA: hypothetical protein VMK65_01465, partial [Longimicrobiales bacterium]|nr:hypothetical protein [Longimicrobiales bacterium]
MLLTRLRRLGRGPSGLFAPAGAGAGALGLVPEAELGVAQAEVIEGPTTLTARTLAAPAASAFTGFLDGVQRATTLGCLDHVPLVYAYGAAVIRARPGRAMATLRGAAGGYHLEREALFVPARLVDPCALASLGLAGDEMHDTGPDVDEPLPLFPPLLLARAFEAVNRWREGLERELAERWCRAGDEGWLLVDGSLTVSSELAECPRAVGVVKSHRTRFFDGEDARVVLGLREGERSAIFRPGTRTFTPVYSWYLRLRDPAGHGPLWGLVRVEAAATDATLAGADD